MGEHEESKTKQGMSSNKKRSNKTNNKHNKGEGKERGSPRSASTANKTSQARMDEAVNNVFVHHVFVHICRPPTFQRADKVI